MEFGFVWEESFLLVLQEQVRRPWLDTFMNGVTQLGEAGIFEILVCLVLLCIPATRLLGKMGATSLALDYVFLNLCLKNLVARVRPYVAIKGLEPITHLPSDYSFPSGHTGIAFALASVIFFKCPRKIGVPALLLAALIGFTRLYLGVHYPTDVIAGAAVGMLTGWVSVWFWERRKQSDKF